MHATSTDRPRDQSSVHGCRQSIASRASSSRYYLHADWATNLFDTHDCATSFRANDTRKPKAAHLPPPTATNMRKEKQQHLPFVTPPIAPVAARAPVEDAAALKARGSLTHGRQEVRAPQNCKIKEWRDAKDRFVKYNLQCNFPNLETPSLNTHEVSPSLTLACMYCTYARRALARSLALRAPIRVPSRSVRCSVSLGTSQEPASTHPPLSAPASTHPPLRALDVAARPPPVVSLPLGQLASRCSRRYASK